MPTLQDLYNRVPQLGSVAAWTKDPAIYGSMGYASGQQYDLGDITPDPRNFTYDANGNEVPATAPDYSQYGTLTMNQAGDSNPTALLNVNPYLPDNLVQVGQLLSGPTPEIKASMLRAVQSGQIPVTWNDQYGWVADKSIAQPIYNSYVQPYLAQSHGSTSWGDKVIPGLVLGSLLGPAGLDVGGMLGLSGAASSAVSSGLTSAITSGGDPTATLTGALTGGAGNFASSSLSDLLGNTTAPVSVGSDANVTSAGTGGYTPAPISTGSTLGSTGLLDNAANSIGSGFDATQAINQAVTGGTLANTLGNAATSIGSSGVAGDAGTGGYTQTPISTGSNVANSGNQTAAAVNPTSIDLGGGYTLQVDNTGAIHLADSGTGNIIASTPAGNAGNVTLDNQGVNMGSTGGATGLDQTLNAVNDPAGVNPVTNVSNGIGLPSLGGFDAQSVINNTVLPQGGLNVTAPNNDMSGYQSNAQISGNSANMVEGQQIGNMTWHNGMLVPTDSLGQPAVQAPQGYEDTFGNWIEGTPPAAQDSGGAAGDANLPQGGGAADMPKQGDISADGTQVWDDIKKQWVPLATLGAGGAGLAALGGGGAATDTANAVTTPITTTGTTTPPVQTTTTPPIQTNLTTPDTTVTTPPNIATTGGTGGQTLNDILAGTATIGGAGTAANALGGTGTATVGDLTNNAANTATLGTNIGTTGVQVAGNGGVIPIGGNATSGTGLDSVNPGSTVGDGTAGNLGNTNTVTPSGSGVSTTTGTGLPSAGAGSLVSRIMGGTASDADWAQFLGTLGTTALGVAGANQQQNALSSLYSNAWNAGAPSRARFESSMTPGFDVKSIPGLSSAMDTATETYLRKLSAQNGNPAGIGGAPAQTESYVLGTVGLPALQNYQSNNSAAGGLPTISGQATGAGTTAAQNSGNIYNAVGYGLGQLTNQQPQNDIFGTSGSGGNQSLAQLLRAAFAGS